MQHHKLDVKSVPQERQPLFVNEPWLIDINSCWREFQSVEPDAAPDNVRVYLPLDINADAVLARLRTVVYR